MNHNSYRLGLLQMTVLLAGTFLVYWPSLRGGFVWDDLFLVKKNVLATGEANLLSIWFSTDFPLAIVVTWFERLMFGDNPTGYRVVNALLHGLSAILLWRVLGKLRIPGAWLAAALFAVHPVCVASVAWISELKNTLSLPFYLVSIWSYLHFVEADATESKGRRRLFYALSLITFFLALTAKTSTVMLPVVLLACVWWKQAHIAKYDLLRVLPHFALALAFGLMTIWFQREGAIRGITVQSEDFAGRLAGAGMAVWFYLSKALLPLNLCMIYPRWEIGTSAFVFFLPLLLLLGVLGIFWGFRQSWGRPALFAFGCFGVSLFPVLGFIDMYFLIFSRVSDHFAYLPLIAVTALVAAAVSRIPRQPLSRGIGMAMIVGLALLTWKRAHVFASDEALWRDTVAKNPQSWNAHNNLACNLAERGELDTAIKHFELSLQLNPDNVSAHRNFGKALAIKGRSAEAESHLRTAIDLKPADADIRADYAGFLAQNNRATEAMEQLREALRLKPAIPQRLQLAALLAASRQDAEAVQEFRQVLVIQPESVEALNNLAWLLATCSDASIRDGSEALRLAHAACRLTEYKQAIALGTLGAAFAETGNFAKAIQSAQQAVDLATATGNEDYARMNQQLIRLYGTGRAAHGGRPNP